MAPSIDREAWAAVMAQVEDICPVAALITDDKSGGHSVALWDNRAGKTASPTAQGVATEDCAERIAFGWLQVGSRL